MLIRVISDSKYLGGIMATRKPRCPKCGGYNLNIVGGAASRDGMVVYRKRECGDCDLCLSTEERLENHRRNRHEDRLLEIFRRLTPNKRKALWNLLKLM